MSTTRVPAEDLLAIRDGGPWWMEPVVDAILALRAGEDGEALDALEGMMTGYAIDYEEEEEDA